MCIFEFDRKTQRYSVIFFKKSRYNRYYGEKIIINNENKFLLIESFQNSQQNKNVKIKKNYQKAINFIVGHINNDSLIKEILQKRLQTLPPTITNIFIDELNNIVCFYSIFIKEQQTNNL